MEAEICIIGAGPAGLMSAIFAAQAGAKVTVLEKNDTAGRKLLLTGGGRCNLTHTGTVDDFIRAYGKQGRFLRHCLHEFAPDATREYFSQLGVATKADEAGCVFPASERSCDVRDTLLRQCQKLGVQFLFGIGVERIEKQDDGFSVFAGGKPMIFQKVIIATGGVSYPETGSTGDGYKLAKSLGHTIIEPRPALVPLVTKEDWPGDLAGTSLGNAKISSVVEGKKIATTGPMIFTHDGIGGPAVLDLSRGLADYLSAIGSADGETSPAAARRGWPVQKPIDIVIDVIPAMRESKLDEYLVGQLSRYSRKIIINVLFDLIPKKLAGLLCRRAGVAETTGSQLKKEQRRRLIQLLKKLPFSITATRPIEEATVTNGGVSTAGIDPKTMQSKVCPDLFFAGEVIDADGPCGGYNLQICWSTGALSGKI